MKSGGAHIRILRERLFLGSFGARLLLVFVREVDHIPYARLYYHLKTRTSNILIVLKIVVKNQLSAPEKFIYLLYVQKVVTLKKKYLTYLHQKMGFTPFINYYDTLGCILFVYRAK